MEYSIENLISFFNQNPQSKYVYKVIKMKFNLKTDEEILRLEKDLQQLKEDGTLLYLDGKYTSFPKNNSYILDTMKISKDDKPYICFDGLEYLISNPENALENDLCIFTVNEINRTAKIRSIVKREKQQIVCEVRNGKLITYGIKPAREITTDKYTTKKLKDGTRISVKLNNNFWDNKIYGDIIEVLGNSYEPDIEVKTILANHGLKISFNQKSLEEEKNIPTEVSEKDIVGRLDLRNKIIFTIDSVRTKDMDDAISLEIKENGNMLLGVHIAHVAYYVKPGMSLFEEAIMERGTSEYPLDYCNPMLPASISNGICSLKPHLDRLTKSTFIEFNKDGNIVDFSVKREKTVIRSAKKMCYHEINKILGENKIVPGYESFVPILRNMHKLSNLLEQQKINNGYLNFGNNDIISIHNSNNQPIGFQKSGDGIAEKIIENFMLIGNEIDAINMYGFIFSYRNHDKPSEEKLNYICDILQTTGLKVPKFKNVTNPMAIQNLLNQVNKVENADIYKRFILRGMARASYSCVNIGHFGLAKPAYAQFTSPIRRASDLLNDALEDIYDDPKTYTPENLKKIEEYTIEACKIASEKERAAEEAEKEALSLKMAEYMEMHIGEVFPSRIVWIDRHGIVIETNNYIQGFISYKSLKNDFYYFNPLKMNAVGKNTKKILKIGNPIDVKVLSASKEFREIEFAAIEKEHQKVLKRKCI